MKVLENCPECKVDVPYYKKTAEKIKCDNGTNNAYMSVIVLRCPNCDHMLHLLPDVESTMRKIERQLEDMP